MSCVSRLQFIFQFNIPNLKVTNQTVTNLTLFTLETIAMNLGTYLPKNQVPTFPRQGTLWKNGSSTREMAMLQEASKHEALIQRNGIEMG